MAEWLQSDAESYALNLAGHNNGGSTLLIDASSVQGQGSQSSTTKQTMGTSWVNVQPNLNEHGGENSSQAKTDTLSYIASISGHQDPM